MEDVQFLKLKEPLVTENTVAITNEGTEKETITYNYIAITHYADGNLALLIVQEKSIETYDTIYVSTNTEESSLLGKNEFAVDINNLDEDIVEFLAKGGYISRTPVGNVFSGMCMYPVAEVTFLNVNGQLKHK